MKAWGPKVPSPVSRADRRRLARHQAWHHARQQLGAGLASVLESLRTAGVVVLVLEIAGQAVAPTWVGVGLLFAPQLVGLAQTFLAWAVHRIRT